MLTPQEVSSHAFTKGLMGGYNMAMVDEFLDELTDDYTALYKENAALKAKMKVLVEKVEDYRATEDSMRATLLTAQKMADSIVREAEARRDNLLAQAETDARDRIGQIQQEVEAAESRLRRGQQELAQFIAAVERVCHKELDFLKELPQLPVDIPVPAVQEIAEDAAASVQEIPAQAETAETAETVSAPVEIPPLAASASAPAEEPYPEGDPFAREPAEELEVTRRIKFDKLDDLKFGPNYTSGN